MPSAWEFINSAGPLALLGWAIINERRFVRLETMVDHIAKQLKAG